MQVQLLDRMGDDLAVVDAARVSFAAKSSWIYVQDPAHGGKSMPRLRESDVRLIKFLAREGHWSPFTHVMAKFHIAAPLFIARQLWKSHIGLASQDESVAWNEVSRRYVKATPTFHTPVEWRMAAEDVKQGSSRETLKGEAKEQADWDLSVLHDHALQVYQDMLTAGVAPEQARMCLPGSVLTEWIWTGSLMAFARVCQQRLGKGAQAEAGDIAAPMLHHLRTICPISTAALMGEA